MSARGRIPHGEAHAAQSEWRCRHYRLVPGIVLRGAVARDEAARQVRDDTGDPVTPAAGPCRIVSLAPGTTAMLYAAGAGHCLVGTIAHSNEPAGRRETSHRRRRGNTRLRATAGAAAHGGRGGRGRRAARAHRSHPGDGHSRVPGACHAPRRDARIAAPARCARRHASGRQPRGRCAEPLARDIRRALPRRGRRSACSTRSGIGLSTRSAAGT